MAAPATPLPLVGSVKVMVVAAQKGAYGSAEKTAPVKKPIMVLATLPRVLGPGEEVVLPVNVFNMNKNSKNISVEVTANGLLEIMDDRKKNISIEGEADQLVYYKLKVKPTIGISKIKIEATSGSEKSTYELNVEVRNPNPKITKIIEKSLAAGEQWNSNYELPGMPGTNQATLEIANIPPMNLESRLDYLIQYPYGCAEQTTSSVFPQLLVKNMVEVDEFNASRMDANIKAGINRVRSFQTSEGGISFWPGYGQNCDWCSNYAGHFMIEAEKKGI